MHRNLELAQFTPPLLGILILSKLLEFKSTNELSDKGFDQLSGIIRKIIPLKDRRRSIPVRHLSLGS